MELLLHLVGILDHRPQLEHLEPHSVGADALRVVEDRATAREADRQDRREQHG
jgi:hypothetical protein